MEVEAVKLVSKKESSGHEVSFGHDETSETNSKVSCYL